MIPDVRVPAKSSAELEAKTTRFRGSPTLLLLGRSRTFELKAEAPLIVSAWCALMAKAKHAVQERWRRRGAEEAAMAAVLFYEAAAGGRPSAHRRRPDSVFESEHSGKCACERTATIHLPASNSNKLHRIQTNTSLSVDVCILYRHHGQPVVKMGRL